MKVKDLIDLAIEYYREHGNVSIADVEVRPSGNARMSFGGSSLNQDNWHVTHDPFAFEREERERILSDEELRRKFISSKERYDR